MGKNISPDFSFSKKMFFGKTFVCNFCVWPPKVCRFNLQLLMNFNVHIPISLSCQNYSGNKFQNLKDLETFAKYQLDLIIHLASSKIPKSALLTGRFPIYVFYPRINFWMDESFFSFKFGIVIVFRQHQMRYILFDLLGKLRNEKKSNLAKLNWSKINSLDRPMR